MKQCPMIGIAILAVMPFAYAETQREPVDASKPLVAVPAFENRTGGHVTRIVPGKYRERNINVGRDTRRETGESDGKRVETTSSRDIYEKQLARDVEFAPGEWKLPENAGEIAADVVSQALTTSGRFRVLNRATFALKQVDSERSFAATSGASPDALIKLCRELNAQYLVSGAISNFRIDERTAEAYGVIRRLVNTRVTLDIRAVDVATGEVVYQAAPTKVVTLQIPEGISQISDIYDWEAALRAAINESANEMVAQMARCTRASLGVPELVSLTVNSSPEGADIIIDDDFVGNTPATVKITKGRHKIRIERQGYQTWEKSVIATDSMKIAPTLEKTPAAPTPEKKEH